MTDEQIKEHLEEVKQELLTLTTEKALLNLFGIECFIAGGCFKSLILGETINDYDVYFKTKKAAEIFLKNKHSIPGFLTKNAYTITLASGKKVQFIYFHHGTPHEIVGSFDFMHTMAYYDFSSAELTLPLITRTAILQRKLTVNKNAKYPLSAVKRMLKFIRQGFTIQDGEIKKLGELLSKVDFKDEKVLQEQERGMYRDR